MKAPGASRGVVDERLIRIPEKFEVGAVCKPDKIICVPEVPALSLELPALSLITIRIWHSAAQKTSVEEYSARLFCRSFPCLDKLPDSGGRDG